MKLYSWFSIAIVLGVSSCADTSSDEPFSIFSSSYDFGTELYGWSGNFADYKISDSLYNELTYSFSNRPSNIALHDDQKSIMLSGNNTNENLFMFVKKKIDGLSPNKNYTIVFEVEFGTNIKTSALSDSIYLKVGATTDEPKKVIQNDYYRIDIDKGVTAKNGKDMVIIGALGASDYSNEYTLVKKSNFSSNDQLISVRANEDGEAWLIVGTDSAFKGSTTIYYTAINVVFSTSK